MVHCHDASLPTLLIAVEVPWGVQHGWQGPVGRHVHAVCMLACTAIKAILKRHWALGVLACFSLMGSHALSQSSWCEQCSLTACITAAPIRTRTPRGRCTCTWLPHLHIRTCTWPPAPAHGHAPLICPRTAAAHNVSTRPRQTHPTYPKKQAYPPLIIIQLPPTL